jgi:hypothetical protein
LEIVKQSEETKICVTIFPDGIFPKDSQKVEMPCHINFNTVAEKEEYVTREYRFTRNQFSEYDAAINTKERFLGRQSLESKRVAFARSQHFGPIEGADGKVREKYQWYFLGADKPTGLA